MERLTFDNNVRYVGKLASISSANPADMIVRFQLSKILNNLILHLKQCGITKNRRKNIVILLYSIFISDPLGSATFVVMDTDYDNHALLCTCQDKKFFFDFLTFHRRSCTILQRTPIRDTSVTSKVKNCQLAERRLPLFFLQLLNSFITDILLVSIVS